MNKIVKNCHNQLWFWRENQQGENEELLRRVIQVVNSLTVRIFKTSQEINKGTSKQKIFAQKGKRYNSFLNEITLKMFFSLAGKRVSRVLFVLAVSLPITRCMDSITISTGPGIRRINRVVQEKVPPKVVKKSTTFSRHFLL